MAPVAPLAGQWRPLRRASCHDIVKSLLAAACTHSRVHSEETVHAKYNTSVEIAVDIAARRAFTDYAAHWPARHYGRSSMD